MASVAIVHDYLTQRGGAERVVLALGARVVVPMDRLALLPEAIARAVLAALAKRAAGELRTAIDSARAEAER